MLRSEESPAPSTCWSPCNITTTTCHGYQDGNCNDITHWQWFALALQKKDVRNRNSYSVYTRHQHWDVSAAFLWFAKLHEINKQNEKREKQDGVAFAFTRATGVENNEVERSVLCCVYHWAAATSLVQNSHKTMIVSKPEVIAFGLTTQWHENLWSQCESGLLKPPTHANASQCHV